MKSYDLVYIVRPDLDAEALRAVTERMAQRITEQGGTIEAVDVWGKRRLTYAVKKHREGVFVHTRFTLDPRRVEEIRRGAALTEDVLRAVITNAVGPTPGAKAEGEGAGPAPAAARAGHPAAPAPAGAPEPRSEV